MNALIKMLKPVARTGQSSSLLLLLFASIGVFGTAQAVNTTLLIEGDDLSQACVANAADEAGAREQFATLCGGTPVDCVEHRAQWQCANAALTTNPIDTTPAAPEESESPFVSNLSVVAQWNELALAAIRAGKAKPTVTAYQLFMVSTAMYDAYTAYTDGPSPYALDASYAAGADQHSAENLEEAVSQAAYKSLTFLFPGFENRYGYFYQYLTALGYEPISGYETNQADETSPSGVGFLSVAAYIDERQFDGSNFRNNFAEAPSMIYPDPYTPVNSPDPIAETGEFGPDFDPNRWQPLRVPNGTVVDEADIPTIDALNLDSFGDQQFLSPHWGAVTPFALTHGAEFRPTPPPMYGSDEPYIDALGVESTNTEAYIRQISEVIEYSADLTDAGKVTAEFWADGPRTESPPGHWNQLAHGIIERDSLSEGESIKLLFAINAALLDASISTWEAKRHYDYIRPASSIRWYFQGQSIQAWGGPEQGTQTIQGENWSPYQKLDFVTPPFPEYVSGHSTFSRAAAEVLIRFTGSDQFYDGQTRTLQDVNGDGELDLLGQHIAPAGSFLIEEGPANDVVLTWPTFIDAADDAGISRLYGGIHIQDGDLRGRELGAKIGARVFETAERYFSGNVDSISE